MLGYYRWVVALGNRYEKRNGAGLSKAVYLVWGSMLNDNSGPPIPYFGFCTLDTAISAAVDETIIV